ncbi:MAG: hypothetical protein AB7I34_21600 [Rhizobiaceae bacterium]
MTALDARRIHLLAKAMGGMTGAIRAALVARPAARGRFMPDPLLVSWSSLVDLMGLGESAGDAATAESWPDDDLAEDAVYALAVLGEAVASALMSIAEGRPVASVDVLQPLLMGEGRLTDLIRQIPEDQFSAIIRQLFGREPLPARLR